MNPLFYYDSIYSLTSLKKREDSYRQFIFKFISTEWSELLENAETDSSSIAKHSFIHQLMRVSKNGRNYTLDEVNDHVGTMLVAVSFIRLASVPTKLLTQLSSPLFPPSDGNL